MERKGFLIRFGAVLIDGLIMGVVYYILNAIFGVKLTVHLGMTPADLIDLAERAASRIYLFYGLVGLAMAAVEVFRAETPGKMLLKLKIVSADATPATQQQLIRRAALKYGAFAIYLIAGVTGITSLAYLAALVGLAYAGGAFMSLGQTRQALHDLLGGTAVVGPPGAPAGFAPVMQAGDTAAPAAAPPPLPTATPPTAPSPASDTAPPPPPSA